MKYINKYYLVLNFKKTKYFLLLKIILLHFENSCN